MERRPVSPRTVVVIGNFDGVHRGHVGLLRLAKESEPNARLVAVTFWPHPMSVVRPDQAPPLLCSLERRLELLTEAGVDDVTVVEFTPEVASWSPEEFVDRVLRPLDPVRVVVGENFRFGFRAAGDVDLLAKLGATRAEPVEVRLESMRAEPVEARLESMRAEPVEAPPSTGPRQGFVVDAVPLFSDGAQPSSSTLIRHAVADGDFGRVRELSDQVFRMSGVVVRGDQRGRQMGFPTANIIPAPGLAVPEDGVYAGWVTRLDIADAPRWPAAISVGTNPTFDGVQRRVEAYVLDRDDLELYDVEIAVDFYTRLRGQVKYRGMEALIEQMHADVEQVRHILHTAG
ncbi:MAG TPA: bifunctional riboflavin kinase/FAD synthetase [Microlunatus sp.]|nr:bifunctional riboflavin kinase/FAD synthetase [Microlunatus sp.]